jgi:hypothetical protein
MPGPGAHGKSSCASDIGLRQLAASDGRGERIRTSGPCLPKTVLYQAELLPDRNPQNEMTLAAGAKAAAE